MTTITTKYNKSPMNRASPLLLFFIIATEQISEIPINTDLTKKLFSIKLYHLSLKLLYYIKMNDKIFFKERQ